MKEDLAKKLKLRIKPENSSVTLALSTSSGQIVGSAEADISVNGKSYPKTKFNIIKDLCTDILLGIDFQQ